MRIFLGCFVSLSLAACEIASQSSPLLSSASPNAASYTVQVTVRGWPPYGDTRSLVAGSRWVEFGRIAEGVVYKPRDTVMTVEGRNISEAYIVIRDGLWVGFWLPVEKGFAPLEKTTPVQLQRGEQ